MLYFDIYLVSLIVLFLSHAVSPWSEARPC